MKRHLFKLAIELKHKYADDFNIIEMDQDLYDHLYEAVFIAGRMNLSEEDFTNKARRIFLKNNRPI